MIGRRELEYPVPDRSEESAKRKKWSERENEWARDEYDEDEGSDEAFGAIFPEEDGESEDAVGPVAGDVFEVFDRNDGEICEEEEGRDRGRESGDILVS